MEDQAGSVALVRELYGAMTAEQADEAILASSGQYTADARAFADGKPIRLVDGRRYSNWCGRQRVEAPPVQTERIDGGPVGSAPVAKAPPTCPRCGSAMVQRIARTGGRPGASFWGCTAFPNCRATRPIA